MIDVSEEVVSSQPARKRTVAAPRVSRRPEAPAHKPLTTQRVCSQANTDPFDQVEWECRTAEITDDAGKVIFKQENVQVPKSWSILATKVVVSKYFYGEMQTPA